MFITGGTQFHASAHYPPGNKQKARTNSCDKAEKKRISEEQNVQSPLMLSEGGRVSAYEPSLQGAGDITVRERDDSVWSLLFFGLLLPRMRPRSGTGNFSSSDVRKLRRLRNQPLSEADPYQPVPLTPIPHKGRLQPKSFVVTPKTKSLQKTNSIVH